MAPNKVSTTIRYSKPGTQPPIYLGGSFDDPQWQRPREMKYTTDENNEHEFYTEVYLEEGKEYQYKFRVGLGDWWVMNESSPTVSDDHGIQNNLLSVPVTEDPTNTFDTKPTAEKPSPNESTPTAEMEHSDRGHVEEGMGTRETSDILFSDEIVKDTEATKASSLPLIVPSFDPDPTPAVELVKDKVELDQDLEDPKNKTGTAHPVESIEAAPVPTPEITLTEPEPKSILADVLEMEKPHTEHIEETHMVVTREQSQDVAPTLVVEKRDSELSHGDGFGVGATTTQKDAHSLRTKDTEPAQTIIRNGAHTPDIADIAAEVADSAQMLDRETLTPPISDEEAGRIGYRRMSDTPIPEVAETAAEVADVAAIIDGHTPLTKKELGDLLESRGYFALMNDMSIEFPETPPNEKVPLYPHERAGPADHTEPSRHTPFDPLARRPSRYEEPIVYDPNDPTIQKFPETREGIMKHLALMQTRLPPDTADCVGGPDCPISEEIHSPGTPVHAIPHQEPSPSLDLIAEENDEEQESLPSAAKVNGDDELTRLSKIAQTEVETDEMNPANDELMKVKLGNPSKEEMKIKGTEPVVSDKGENAKLEPVISSPAEVLSVSVHEPESELMNHIDRSLDGAEGAGSIPLPVSPTIIPSTPFVVGNRQLGYDVDDVQAITFPSGPSIRVNPATPGGSAVEPEPLNQPTSQQTDTAETTAIADKESSSTIRSRKQAPSPVPDRPLSPSSIRKDAGSRHFLKAFWRVVFVEWIGGLIMRLCGGRGRRTLLTVGAVSTIAIAPALYYFFSTPTALEYVRIPQHE